MENPFTNKGLVVEEVGRDALMIPRDTPAYELTEAAQRIGEIKASLAAVLPQPEKVEVPTE